MDRIEEYDDGYSSKEDFERAGCDTEETLGYDKIVDDWRSESQYDDINYF